MFAFLNCISVSHLLDFSRAGLWVLKPESSRKINSPKSYRIPKPVPMATSLKSRRPSNRLLGSVTSSNTFQIFPEEYYISTNTVCNFNIRYISKPMNVVMESTYIFDDNFQVIQHNIESVEINNKKVNAMELVNDYLNKRDNKSIIEFLAFIFIKRR